MILKSLYRWNTNPSIIATRTFSNFSTIRVMLLYLITATASDLSNINDMKRLTRLCMIDLIAYCFNFTQVYNYACVLVLQITK